MLTALTLAVLAFAQDSTEAPAPSAPAPSEAPAPQAEPEEPAPPTEAAEPTEATEEAAAAAEAERAKAEKAAKADDREEAENHASALFILALLPDDSAYPIGMVMFDRGYLHLETRYNYEGSRTGSILAGPNLSVGDKVNFWVQPMLGVAFGENFGGALPSWKAGLAWYVLDLYFEGEFYVDFKNPGEDSFLFAWTELNVHPVKWARVGIVANRTRAFGDPYFFQPGAFVGLSEDFLGVTFYVFSLFNGPPTFQASIFMKI